MEEKDIKRLMMQFDHLLRKTNEENINPAINSLCIDELQPIITLVARARALYLDYMFQLGKQYEGSTEFPSQKEIDTLAGLRRQFEELTAGSQAFEASIQRGYLDVKPS